MADYQPSRGIFWHEKKFTKIWDQEVGFFKGVHQGGCQLLEKAQNGLKFSQIYPNPFLLWAYGILNVKQYVLHSSGCFIVSVDVLGCAGTARQVHPLSMKDQK